jgi:N-acetylmuramoyl-L-alanine amidase
MESRKSRRRDIKRRRSVNRRHGFPEPTTQRKSTFIITKQRRFFKRQKKCPKIVPVLVLLFGIGTIFADIRILPGIIRAARSEQVQQSDTQATEDTEQTEQIAQVEQPEPAAAVPDTEDTETPACRWTTYEGYIMARMAMAEAEDQDTEGKALVILVILNRVEDEHFPDTIEGVIEQKNAFSSYTNGRYDRVEPDDDCSAALSLVASGWDESEGATFFEAGATDDTWHARNLQTLFTHGAHTFYREKEEEKN